MYNNNFVSVIKSKGKILREYENGVVKLPFGSSYSILLKNLNTVDVVVDVEIDGENVLQGNNLLISANSSFELVGKLKDLNKSNKFKFIHKTKQISDYRGDREDDSIVRITYSFVKPPVVSVSYYNPWEVRYRAMPPGFQEPYEVTYGCSNSSNIKGITVKGEEFNCDFNIETTGDLESETHLIIFKLVGKTKDKKKIKKHLYVNTVLICETCGKKSKSSKKYCSSCGTYLR